MKLFLTSLLLIGAVFCQHDYDDLQDLEKTIGEQIPSLGNFDKNNLPSVDDVTNVLKAKCDQNGGDGAFDRLQAANDQLLICLRSHFNATIIFAEVDEAKKTGSMDEVFAKYCKKTPLISKCVQTLTESVEPCLEEREKGNLHVMVNISESFAEHMCMKDGDRLAMFIAEGGYECLEKQQDNIQKCLNATLAQRIPTELTVKTLPLLVFDTQECGDYDKIHHCVVTELENCKDRTPANIIDSVLKYVRHITPCNDFSIKSQHSQSSDNYKRNRRAGEDDILAELGRQQAGGNPLSALMGPTGEKCQKKGVQAAQEMQMAMANYQRCVMQQLPFVEQIAQAIMGQAMSSLQQMQQMQQQMQQMQQQMQHRTRRAMQSTTQGFPNIGKEAFEHICGSLQHNISKCDKTEIKQKFKACLEPKEEYVPDFLFEMMDSVLNYTCGEGLNNMKMEMFAGTSCVNKNKCKLKTFTTDNNGDVVTKKELCSDLKQLRECTEEHNEENCKDSEALGKFVNGLIGAMHAPCSGSTTYLNKLIALAFIVFTFYKMFPEI